MYCTEFRCYFNAYFHFYCNSGIQMHFPRLFPLFRIPRLHGVAKNLFFFQNYLSRREGEGCKAPRKHEIQ